MAASEEIGRTRVALPTAIAGLLGTLAGTVVGGLISLKAVDATIEAAQESEVRTTRQQAYSVFASDLTRHVQLLEDRVADGSIDAKESIELDKANLGVVRDFGATALIGSDNVRQILIDLNKKEVAFEEAARKGELNDDIRQAYYYAFNHFLDVARDEIVPGGG